MGFLVLVPESVIPAQIAKYRLIDGQQRLTTFSLVLCALREGAAAAGPPVRPALHATLRIDFTRTCAPGGRRWTSAASWPATTGTTTSCTPV
jgi:hypothetical protein